jgi:hypothetical protein
MQDDRRRTRIRWVAAACAAACVGQLTVGAQEPTATSAAPVKELVALLQSKKLEAYAVRDTTDASRFVAVLLVPGVQLMLVSAGYGRPTDVEYRIYMKDFMNAYMDLNSSVLSKDKVFFEDRLCDGLVVKPTDGIDDAVTIGADKRVFDGEFADPKKKKDAKKISQADYFKAYTEADAQYTKLLTMLLNELKKSS